MNALTTLADLKTLAEKIEARIEKRFEVFARDPKVLALVARSLNQASQWKLDLATMNREFASLRVRAKNETLRLLNARHRTHRVRR